MAAKKTSAGSKKKSTALKKKAVSKKVVSKKVAKKSALNKKSSATKKPAAIGKKTKTSKKPTVKPRERKKAAVASRPISSELSPTAILKVGDLAPDFSLPNQDGKIVALKDFVGKQHVVLYFYPKAMTPGCTVQACGIRDSAEQFRQAGAVVLGVSPDKVPALTKFRQRDQLNFDLLSDENKSLAKSYGVWGLKKFMGREFMGVRRWTFIIGKDRKIKQVMDQVNTQTHHNDVLAILTTL